MSCSLWCARTGGASVFLHEFLVLFEEAWSSGCAGMLGVGWGQGKQVEPKVAFSPCRCCGVLLCRSVLLVVQVSTTGWPSVPQSSGCALAKSKRRRSHTEDALVVHWSDASEAYCLRLNSPLR